MVENLCVMAGTRIRTDRGADGIDDFLSKYDLVADYAESPTGERIPGNIEGIRRVGDDKFRNRYSFEFSWGDDDSNEGDYCVGVDCGQGLETVFQYENAAAFERALAEVRQDIPDAELLFFSNSV